MNWGKSFTYIFDDKDWVTKVLIGGVLSLVPIVNLVVVGYALKALKNVAEGGEQPLPAWDDFGEYFVQGLVSTLATLVWALPIIIIGTVMAVLSTMIGYDSTQASRVAMPYALCSWSVSCVSGIYGLFLGLVLPAAYIEYAIHGDWGAFFRCGNMFRFIKANLGNYIIALLLAAVAQFIASFGIILCMIGIAFTQFWATLAGSHLLGQVYRSSQTPAPPEVLAEPTV